MTKRITGKLRTQYINEWLEGVENPDVEVKPMRDEGRFIVRYKNTQNGTADQNVTEPSSEAPAEIEAADTNSNNQPVEVVAKGPDENKPTAQSDEEEGNNNEILTQIFNQLRIINEERHAKQLRKEQKKELQHAIRKEFVRHRVLVEDPDPRPEPVGRWPASNSVGEPVYIDRTLPEANARVPRTPVRMRRRLNLLNK